MRVAALYDIHGNIDALNSVLAELEAANVDRIVIGGDITWGPFPVETVRAIRQLGASIIRGNADREVAARADESDGLDDWVAEVNLWCADQLPDDDLRFLTTLPQTVALNLPKMGEVLFCHGTPRSDEDIVTPVTPDEDLAAVLRDVDHAVVVCGHTHSQFERSIGDKRVINAGSVGLPYEDEPGAYWALIASDVELRRTEYDFPAAAERIRSSTCPHAERFARAITSPISRDTAIQNFEAQRLRS